MNIFYQGTDITKYVLVRSCIGRDSAGDRCDSLRIIFEDAETWYSWGPKEDDEIRVTHDKYDSGILYLNTVLPEDGRFAVFASALPCKARKKECRSFAWKSIEEIMKSCGMSSGMGYRLFGVEGGTVIPYIEQEDESCAKFLLRLLRMEGAELKCVNGKYVAIGTQYAQDLPPSQSVELTATQSGAEYRRSGNKLRALTIRTPHTAATATDLNVPSDHRWSVRNDIPARDAGQAGRWARGLLLHENRKCEALKLESRFNIGFTAMTRIDIKGQTDAAGEWIIQEAEHDFINLTSTAVMHRCIRSIQ